MKLLIINIIIFSFHFLSHASTNEKFILVAEYRQAKIFLHPSEPEFIHKAVLDVVSDVKKITGKSLKVIKNSSDCSNCILVGTLTNPSFSRLISKQLTIDSKEIFGEWEAFHIGQSKTNPETLIITGSDTRGTMFGLYHFIEHYLEVDPLYFWSDREPAKRPELFWDQIAYISKSPAFKFRGWFINDEDLLTDWMPSGGKRRINYPYYQDVVNPYIMEMVVEALVRSRMNLIIPASFIDIMNPAEEALVKIAADRGVYISQHHVEPLGVSAFSFFNYWKDKGEEKLFSFYSSKDELIEVWEKYVQKWAEYPNVLWQIGLRGIADRPMWMADPNIPQSEEDYGWIISEAMKTQIEITKKYTNSKNLNFTTTLWAEGAVLFEEGHLDIPEECIVIFSDNSPGWIFSPDFYNVSRDDKRSYGIYYHQQVWGTGPHLAPAVHPRRTHKLFGEAIQRESNDYAIINVSNIREFVFGIDATSKMLNHFYDFDIDKHLKNWFNSRYPNAPEKTKQAYEDYYNIFVENDEKGVPILLDAQTRGSGNNHLQKIQLFVKDREKYISEQSPETSSSISQEQQWGKRYLSAQFQGPVEPTLYHKKVKEQRCKLMKAQVSAEELIPLLSNSEFQYYKVDLLANVYLMSGLIKWLDHILQTRQAIDIGDELYALDQLELAASWLDDVRRARMLKTQGRWVNWYRGDTKVNLPNTEKNTQITLDIMRDYVLNKGNLND